MNIYVCIKLVPASSKVKVDPDTGVLIRDGIDTKMNPYDLYALETALSLKSQLGGKVCAITMGPISAKAVLLEALYMGADNGILISDRRFGGADVLSTAYTLSSAIKDLSDFDLILCGKQTTDGDTAQVGSEMAEFLDLPQYSNVQTVAPGKDGALIVTSLLGDTVLTGEITTPCLLQTDALINTPRLPSLLRKLSLTNVDDLIRMLTLDDFSDHDPSHYGLNGSATSVERIFPPEKSEDRVTLRGNKEELTDSIFNVLTEKKLW